MCGVVNIQDESDEGGHTSAERLPAAAARDRSRSPPPSLMNCRLLFLPYTKCRCNSSARANVEQTNPHDAIRLGEVSHVEARGPIYKISYDNLTIILR